ncbi:MAG: hypothetical protein AB7V40_04340 [Methyloceanibacter sp.]
MALARKILILGASYGSLLATKFLLAGQTVGLVCSAQEADLIAREGILLRIASKRRGQPNEINSKRLPGLLNVMTPDVADPDEYDLVCLAMQEPQYRSPDVWQLLSRIGASGTPVLSIMNLPPIPYLARIPALDLKSLEFCYADARLWDGFRPGIFTQASADPQAFRPAGSPANVLQVTLATNFKVARFENPAHTAMLRDLETAIEAGRFGHSDGSFSGMPVKLKVCDSVFIPLRKWSMMLTGNYRCVRAEGICSIREAVHSNLPVSRDIYDWVNSVLLAIGASESDIVPFEDYARAALDLTVPSSIARVLASRGTEIERVDLLVQSVAASRGLRNHHVDASTDLVDVWLRRNRGSCEAGS